MQIKTLSFSHQLLCEHRVVERLNQRKKINQKYLVVENEQKIKLLDIS